VRKIGDITLASIVIRKLPYSIYLSPIRNRPKHKQ